MLYLMLATEGDTKVGAGQSQERGLSLQTENDHHTVPPPPGNISPDWPAFHFVFIRGDAARTMGSQDDGGEDCASGTESGFQYSAAPQAYTLNPAAIDSEARSTRVHGSLPSTSSATATATRRSSFALSSVLTSSTSRSPAALGRRTIVPAGWPR